MSINVFWFNDLAFLLVYVVMSNHYLSRYATSFGLSRLTGHEDARFCIAAIHDTGEAIEVA